jgi:LURP-one-related
MSSVQVMLPLVLGALSDGPVQAGAESNGRTDGISRTAQERREERREYRDERRRGDNAVHYQMRRRLVSIGDDYWVEDDEGRRVFKVDGKALRIRQTMNFDDAQGKTLLRIQERKLRMRDTMEIEDADGRTVATFKKAMVSPLRERMTVSVEAGLTCAFKGICSTTSTGSSRTACRLPGVRVDHHYLDTRPERFGVGAQPGLHRGAGAAVDLPNDACSPVMSTNPGLPRVRAPPPDPTILTRAVMNTVGQPANTATSITTGYGCCSTTAASAKITHRRESEPVLPGSLRRAP